MKLSIFAICFGALVTTSAFANSTVSPYMKMGAKGTLIKTEATPAVDTSSNEESSEEQKTEYNTKIMPMIGVGVRRIEGNFGTDISADFAWKKEDKETISSYTAPKVMFLGYLFPQKFTSLYAGLGTSWSGVEIENNTFHGLFGNAAVGAEFNHTSKIKGMLEVNCDVPAIAASSKGERPYPLVSLRLGVGF